MPFVEYDKRLYQLNAGRNLLGSGVEADVHLPELPSCCQVGINVEPYGSFAWLSGESDNVTINGHPIIDEEPVPLFDGDQRCESSSASYLSRNRNCHTTAS